jgi:hypothetical protein
LGVKSLSRALAVYKPPPHKKTAADSALGRRPVFFWGARCAAWPVVKALPPKKPLSGWERGADSALGQGLREAGPWFWGGRAALLGL